jgi:uncharacterized iron-regulated membrane protein
MKWLLLRAYAHLLLLGLCAWLVMSLLCGWFAQALALVMPKADAVVWSSLAGLPIVLLVGWFGISRRTLKQMHKYWGLLLITFATVIWSSGTASYFRIELDTWSLPQAAQAQLAAQQKREAGLDDVALQALTDAALPKIQQHLQEHAATASTWYIQLPSARAQYFTLNWQSADRSMHQQLLDRSGKPLVAAAEVKWSDPPRLGTWFFQLHYTLLGALGDLSRYVVAFTALLLLWLSLSGLRLWLIRRKYAEQASVASQLCQQVLAMTPAVAKADVARADVAKAQRWHIWSGLIALPSLLLVSSSALVTMLWQLNTSPLNTLYAQNNGQFYAEVLPWLGGSHDAVGTSSVVDLKLLLAAHSRFPVGKIQVNQPGADNSTVLLTQAAESQVSNQLAQVVYDRQGQVLQTSDSQSRAGMQLRSYWYGLHQALFAGPLLRVLMAIASGLLLFVMWFGLRQWRARRVLAWYWQAIVSTILPGVPLVMLSMAVALPLWSQLAQTPSALFTEHLPYTGQWLVGLGLCLMINLLRFKLRRANQQQ